MFNFTNRENESVPELLKKLIATCGQLVLAILRFIGRSVKNTTLALRDCIAKHPNIVTAVLVASLACNIIGGAWAAQNHVVATTENTQQSTTDSDGYERKNGHLVPNAKNLELFMERTIAERASKTELYGVDISAYQSSTYSDNVMNADDFVICRVAAGTNIDGYCDRMYQYAIEHNKLLGVYFYTDAKSWAKDPTEHAKWCAEQTSNYLGWAVFALDAENPDNKVDVKWCTAWLRAFKEASGVTPVLYINRASENENDWTDIANNYELWCADYTIAPTPHPALKYWEDAIMHQYTTTNETLDQDVFFGTAEHWWKLAQKQ